MQANYVSWATMLCCCAAFFVGTAACNVAAQEGLPPSAAPADVVEWLHEELVAVAAQDGGVDSRYARLQPVVERTHDLRYIAELAVRRYWGEWSAADQQRYLAAFERLSVMTYATRFAAATPATFELGTSEVDGDRSALVHASVTRATGSDVTLDYQLHTTGAGWQIINVLADEVSDLALKRAEYHRILGSGSIDDLIAEIETQTARLQQN
jgi:phospholipid transport system substrate-binding protein